MSPATPIRQPANGASPRRARSARVTRADARPRPRSAYERSRDAMRLDPYSPVRHPR